MNHTYHLCKNSQQRPGRREDCTNCNPGKRADKSNEIIVRQAARIVELEKALYDIVEYFSDGPVDYDVLDYLNTARDLIAKRHS